MRSSSNYNSNTITINLGLAGCIILILIRLVILLFSRYSLFLRTLSCSNPAASITAICFTGCEKRLLSLYKIHHIIGVYTGQRSASFCSCTCKRFTDFSYMQSQSRKQFIGIANTILLDVRDQSPAGYTTPELCMALSIVCGPQRLKG